MPKKSQKVASVLKPAEELLIDNLETLKVISDPLRMQIIQQLMVPQTVKSLAKTLHLATTKLYYHVGILERHGLVRVVSTRVVSGILEKSYQVTAYKFDTKSGLISSQATMDEAMALFENMLESAKQDLRRSYNADLIGPSKGEPRNPERVVSMSRSIFALTRDQAELVLERLGELLQELSQLSPDQAELPENAHAYSFTFAFHRTVDPPRARDQSTKKD